MTQKKSEREEEAQFVNDSMAGAARIVHSRIG